LITILLDLPAEPLIPSSISSIIGRCCNRSLDQVLLPFDYIGSAEGHEYPNLQVGDEVNPRPFFALTHIDQPLLLLK